jgi:hypothetical protein
MADETSLERPEGIKVERNLDSIPKEGTKITSKFHSYNFQMSM